MLINSCRLRLFKTYLRIIISTSVQLVSWATTTVMMVVVERKRKLSVCYRGAQVDVQSFFPISILHTSIKIVYSYHFTVYHGITCHIVQNSYCHFNITLMKV